MMCLSEVQFFQIVLLVGIVMGIQLMLLLRIIEEWYRKRNPKEASK